jgi:hypothetical protein
MLLYVFLGKGAQLQQFIMILNGKGPVTFLVCRIILQIDVVEININ